MSKSILVIDTPKSCSECDLCEHITWWSKEKITANFDCAILGIEKFSKDSKDSWSSPRHPQCPLQDTTELLEALEYLYTMSCIDILNDKELRDLAYNKLHKALGGQDE